jgi:hypothetical protein
MPAVKSDTTVFSARVLNGGAGSTVNSGFVDLRTRYGGVWQVKVTNGATRPSQGVTVQAEISPNQIAGNEFPFDCRHTAGQDANEVSKFTIRIPPEVKFTRLSVGEADEDTTIDAILTSLDQV